MGGGLDGDMHGRTPEWGVMGQHCNVSPSMCPYIYFLFQEGEQLKGKNQSNKKPVMCC